MPVTHGNCLLGSEVDVLVYDAHCGFDPDSFAAALGALCGGGLLLLLTPELEKWPYLSDPQTARLAVHPFSGDDSTGRYLRRFIRILVESAGVTLAFESRPVPALPSRDAVLAVDRREGDCRTNDQARAVEAILSTANARGRSVLVLKADRGRGKSSALGIAVARMVSQQPRNILVTAPRRSAVHPLFDHAACRLPDPRIDLNRISSRDSWLEFLPPDQACRYPAEADLLLIDEAAGIPAPLLEKLLRMYPRVVFATTVQGYEGAGRGFEVRFRRTLDRLAPGWREFCLETPIRWAPNDPLEAFAGRALLLDAVPAPAERVAGAYPGACCVRRLDRDGLVDEYGSDSERVLSQLFGLLVLAHYQTRPMDARHLLDGTNLRIYALFYQHQVAATALVAIEGPIGSDLAGDIFEGRRRPRGHLLPQTLCSHAGLRSAIALSYARIIRIAVHPAARGRGLGRLLLMGVVEDAIELGLDLAGSSFGASADLLEFWERCGFRAVHIGTRRNAASGAYAAVVLRPLSAPGASLKTQAIKRLGERLPLLMAEPLRDLEPVIAAHLLRQAPGSEWCASQEVRQELEAFAFALRSYEAALPALVRLVAASIGQTMRAEVLDVPERDALIYKLLQRRDWGETARLLGLSGRAQVTALLRKAAAKLVRCYFA